MSALEARSQLRVEERDQAADQGEWGTEPDDGRETGVGEQRGQPADESALDRVESQENPAGGSGTKVAAIVLIAVVLALALCGAGWGWFHRGGRYDPAGSGGVARLP